MIPARPIDEFLEVLHRDFRKESTSKGKAIQIRTYMEPICKTVAVLVNNGKDLLIKDWHDRIIKQARERGIDQYSLDIHASKYIELNNIYPMGNLKGHDNREQCLVDENRCEQALHTIQRDLPLLCADLETLGHDFVGALWLQQNAHVSRKRAQILANAFQENLPGDPSVLDESWKRTEHALESLIQQGLMPETQLHGLRKDPNLARRIGRAITGFIQIGARSDDHCALRTFASQLPATEWVAKWLEEDRSLHEQTRIEDVRIPILRIRLLAPEGDDGWDLCDNLDDFDGTDLFAEGDWEVDRRVEFWDEYGNRRIVPVEGSPAGSADALANELLRATTHALNALRRGGAIPESLGQADVAMLLVVPEDYVPFDWEGLAARVSRTRRVRLADAMLTVVVEPSNEFDCRGRGPDRFHFDDVAVYESADRRSRFANADKKLCLALRAAWTPSRGRAATATLLLERPHHRTLVLQMPSDEPIAAASELGLTPTGRARATGALIRDAGRRRQQDPDLGPGAYRVIWLDGRFTSPAAVS